MFIENSHRSKTQSFSQQVFFLGLFRLRVPSNRAFVYCTQQIIQHKHFNTLQAPARFPDDEWAELFSVYLLRLCIWFGGVAFFVDTWKNEFPCLRLIPGVWFLRPLISCVEPLGRVSLGLTSHFIDRRISPVNGFFYPFFWFRVSRYIEFLGPERYSDKVVHFITLWSWSV